VSDDRPDYSSIQAVLFGPHLLAGLTHGRLPVTDSAHSNDGLTPGMWEVNATSIAPVTDWVTPVHSESLNPQLVTLTQSSGGKTLVVSESIVDGKLAMLEAPAPGSDACVHATLRVYNPPGSGGLQGKNVMIEPFDKPGMAVTNAPTVGRPEGPNSLFNALPGLDGMPGSVSLELVTKPGCFITALAGTSATQVACQGNGVGASSGNDIAFRRAASFSKAPPLRRYDPLSFAARGTERNFLLEPLRSLQDEFYTAYFSLVSHADSLHVNEPKK
jgi:uncharacterized protein